MMFESRIRAGVSAGSGRQGAAAELQEAVSRASDSLNRLNSEFQASRASDANTTFQHLRVQESIANRVKVATQESVNSCENNIGKCVDLLERLERAEELALRIKNLRNIVDRVARKIG
eukprot:g3320.t1